MASGPSDGDADKVVHAAGGIVLREAPGGLEVALVHRPEHGDWSFPKGKREGDETDEQCALREVAEETGFFCELGVLVSTVGYRDAKGRPKVVRYFLMRPRSGEFAPNDEVDELRWVPLRDAGSLLSYERDREVLTPLDALSLAPTP